MTTYPTASPRPQPSLPLLLNLAGLLLFLAGIAVIITVAWIKDPLLGAAVTGAGTAFVGWRLATSEPRKV